MKKKWSNKELAGKVETEGLDYAILHYLNPEDIKDEVLKEHWKKAKEELKFIDDYLSKYYEGY